MPKFNVTATFEVETIHEPYLTFGEGEAVEFTDNSSFGSENLTLTGGDLEFTVEAENEDAADDVIREIVYDGMEIEDDSGFTWTVENLDLRVEEVEEEMDIVKASEILSNYVVSWNCPDEVKAALQFILDYVQRTPFSG